MLLRKIKACFDDIGEMSGMSEALAGKVFNTFCTCVAEFLFSSWLQMPEGEDLLETTRGICGFGFSSGCRLDEGKARTLGSRTSLEWLRAYVQGNFFHSRL